MATVHIPFVQAQRFLCALLCSAVLMQQLCSDTQHEEDEETIILEEESEEEELLAAAYPLHEIIYGRLGDGRSAIFKNLCEAIHDVSWQ